MLKISKIREVRDQKNICLLLDHRKKQFPGGLVVGLGVATFSHLRHVVPPLKIPCLAPVMSAERVRYFWSRSALLCSYGT